MIQSFTNSLEERLNEFIGTNAIIMQDGFIESKYWVEKLKYSIEYENLTIADKEGTNYLKINLNQIYNIDKKDNEFKFYLDNDLNISIKIKR